MGRMFQIHEDDLAALESTLPKIIDRLYTMCQIDNQLRTQIRRVQKVIVDVRWDYGPHTDIEIIPADEEPTP